MNTGVNRRHLLLCVLLFAGLARFLTLGAYPLFDTTEARYAEIARKMAETGNWVTPQFDYGVPFWGKPPLSTWAAAGSIRLFGANEFAARLPSFLFMAGVAWLTYLLGLRRRGGDFALAAALVLSTTVLFFVAGGSVMTDPAMVLGTTLSMVSFWFAVDEEGRRGAWGYAFFVGLAIGLLAKGPVALVLTLLPTGLWTAWKRTPRRVWQRLPWLGGPLLMLLITLPWYLAAERATPGFLNYFLLGENLKRFTESGWRGDLYGTAHSHHRGTIWLYWLAATSPWCMVFIRALADKSCDRKRLLGDGWPAYLIVWAATPLLFFSLAGNILWTYVLPGLPALALLSSELLCARPSEPDGGRLPRLLITVGVAVPCAFLLLLLFFDPGRIMETQKGVVRGYLDARPDKASMLVYLYHRPSSAQFYSRGAARELRDAAATGEFLHMGAPSFFVVEKNRVPTLPAGFAAQVETAGDYGKYLLLRERPEPRPGVTGGRKN